jgi:hypothetical protein
MQIFVIFFYIYLFKIFECDYVIYKNKWKVELKSSLVTFLPEFRTSFDIHWLNASEIKIIYLGKTIKES